MAYKWIKENVSVQRLADGAFIPNDERNVDWQEFQKWVTAGNTPLPEDLPPPPSNVAESIARARATKIEELERQLRLGVAQSEINAAILDLLKE